MALLKFKRSATPSKVPTTSDLSLGELAMNTYDGKLYMKKDDGTQAIVEIGAASGGGTWGSITGTLSNQTDLWNALSAKQDSATALTTTTSFSGDVSGTYNNIIVADDSHNHIIANVDGLQAALDGKADLAGDTFTGNVTILPPAGWSTGNTAYLYLGDTNNGVSSTFGNPTNVFGFHGVTFSAQGSQLGSFDASGNGYATASFRAPIFYDSANTAYYLDPANTGTSLNVAGKIYGVNEFYTSTAQNSWAFRATTGASSNSSGLWFSGETARLLLRDSSGTIKTQLSADGSTSTNQINGNPIFHSGHAPFADLTAKTSGTGTYQTSGDFRAPRFYDSNNTAYYVDAASTSVFNKLTTSRASADQLKLERTNSDNNVNIEFVGTSTTRYLGKVGGDLKWGANADLNNTGDTIFHDGYHPNADTLTGFNNPTTAPTANTIAYRNSNGDIAAREIILSSGLSSATPTVLVSMYPTTNQLVRTTPAAVATSIQSAATGRWNIDVTATNDVRAPIFYDSNNTAYYTDPASTSNLYNLTISGSGHKYLQISASTSSEAMVRYIGSAGSSWYVGKRITSQLVGTESFHFYSQAAGATVAGIDTSGNIFSSGSVRSPIFYDSDNTGYNLNANGSAWQLQTPTGYLRAGPMNTGFCHFNTDRARYYFDKEVQFDGGINDYSGNWRFNDSLGQHDVSLRAPLFYDSNNTAYYIHADGTSVLNGLTVQGRNWTGGISGAQNYVASSTSTSNRGNYGSGVWAYSGYSTGTNRPFTYDATLQVMPRDNLGFEISADWVSPTGTPLKVRSLRDCCQGWSTWVDIATSSHSFTNSVDLRAPLLYDSNNTAYYADLGSTGSSIRTAGPVSVGTTSSAVQLTVAGAAGVDGIDLQVDTTNSVNSGRMFWTNGTAGQGVAIYNGSGNMYLTTGATPNSTSGSTRMVIYSGNYVAAAGSFRAPIFYDSNNTGRYADLSSTGDSIRASGDIVAYYSDDRLKDRGDNIASALDKVQSLNGFHYTANETAQKFGYKANPQVGVSAQEVEAVLPEVVKEAAIGHGYKTVDYAKLVPLLIEAIKELKAEVETLKKG